MLCGLSFGCVAQAQHANHVGLIDHAAVIEEVAHLKISLDAKKLTGYLEAPICYVRCKMTRLTITPETIASQKGVQVPLKQVKQLYGRSAGIVYDKEKLTVLKISW